ncbi:MAG: hypothetical protein IJ558_01960 [Treponema sp.]|nr:hypothetical protein [Treponema sp.]
MKRIAFVFHLGLLLALVFVSCSSVSMHPAAYVEGTENFISSDIEHKQLARRIIWKNYELKLEGVRNNLTQRTIDGRGKLSGTLSQHGTFYKNGEELFSTDIFNEVDGYVAETKNSRDTLTDNSYRIETGTEKSVFLLNTTGDDTLLKDERDFSVVFTQISTSINEHGKIYNMWFNATMGISVEVDGELYAVVDYYHNPPRVRENPQFSKTLTETQKDELVSLMLALFNYEVSFKSTDLEASSKIDIR